ncbi:MAG: DUF2207 domain-containing protein [Bacteroidales bacterium]|nr:DUF2207 domain-containing protein [Bacteroidales bacterium]
MKKAILVLFLLSLLAPCLHSQNQEIRDVDITIRLSAKGSAIFNERWDINTGPSITEWYLVRENLGDIVIPGFTVVDGDSGKKLEDIGEWDINKTLDEKAGKSGIVHKDEGVELCWGIAPRGDRVFYAIYSMVKAMKSLNDYDMLHLQVVSPGLSSPPQHVKVTVKSADFQLDTTNTRAWGFGFEGTTTFMDSTIVFESTKPFRKNDSAIILLRFNKGLFEPLSVQEKDFQEVLDVALNKAKFADDPEDDTFAEVLAGLLTFLFMYFLFVHPFVRMFRRSSGKISKREKKRILGINPKNVEWYRDIPLEGNLAADEFILRKIVDKHKDNNLALAIILRLVHEGYLEPTREFEDKNIELKFTDKEPSGMNSYQKRFYDIIKASAGEDNVLQDKEFSKWAKANSSKVYHWTQDSLTSGSSYLKEKGYYNRNYKFTSSGQEQARHLAGLKKYLEDFTLVSKRETIEARLWKEYLVHAALFGIADKVAKQLKDIDPKLFSQTFTYDYKTFSSIMNSSHAISDHIRNAYVLGTPRPSYSFSGGGSSSSGSHSSRGGYGGYTSSRGGGGYSGGGRGGGGR